MYVEENSFDYLLKRMYFALGRSRGESYEKAIESDIQPEYRRIVKEKISSDGIPQTPRLFVYLTDYETMEIVSKLKGFFSDQMQKHIIPIAPVSKKRGSSALLVSPVLMENIREKLQLIEKENPGKETRVTIFIASVTSTKMQRHLTICTGEEFSPVAVWFHRKYKSELRRFAGSIRSTGLKSAFSIGERPEQRGSNH